MCRLRPDFPAGSIIKGPGGIDHPMIIIEAVPGWVQNNFNLIVLPDIGVVFLPFCGYDIRHIRLFTVKGKIQSVSQILHRYFCFRESFSRGISAAANKPLPDFLPTNRL